MGSRGLGSKTVVFLEKCQIKTDLFVDANEQAWGTFKEGIRIEAPDALEKTMPANRLSLSERRFLMM